MHTFSATLLNGMRLSGDRILLKWPEDGKLRAWQATELLKLLGSFQSQLGDPAGISGRVYMPLQSLSPPMLMAMLGVMGFGGSLLIPPKGRWIGILRHWASRADFGGVLLVGAAPRLLVWGLKGLGIPVLTLSQQESQRSPEAYPVRPEQAALISYSSGSTGEPKQLFRSHSVLQAQHECLKACFPPFEGQVDCSIFPNVLLHQLASGTCSLIPDQLSKGIERLAYEHLPQRWQESGVNTLTGNPWFYNRLMDSNSEPLEGMRACGIGGAPVDEVLLRRMRMFFPKADLYVIYGATEAEPIALRLYNVECDPRMGYCVGKPVDCLTGLEIRDPQPIKTPVGWLKAGEIFVQGAHVLSESEWHGTGDYGYLWEGQLYLTARAGNTELCNGYHHYQVEHTLRIQPGVSQVALISRRMETCFYYSGELSELQIKNLLESFFPEVSTLRIKRRKSIPLDSRHQSKILYHKL